MWTDHFLVMTKLNFGVHNFLLIFLLVLDLPKLAMNFTVYDNKIRELNGDKEMKIIPSHSSHNGHL